MVEFDDPSTLTNAELLTLYQEWGYEAGDPRSDAIAAEFEKRHLGV